MKRLLCAIASILAVCALLSGCAEPVRCQATFLTLFDTVTTITGYAPDKASFGGVSQQIYDALAEYNALYDIYNDYDGVNNIKTINDNAGIAPVRVDERVLDLLEFGKEVYRLTGGEVNIAMGSVLSLWHDARANGIDDPENAALPDAQMLRDAAEHTNIDDIIIDRGAGTAYLADPRMRLDVGAVAKGYAAQRVCDELRLDGAKGIVISVGGNVCAIGRRADGTPWRVGVEDPHAQNGSYMAHISAENVSVVTSGSYQRYYTVDGTRYHHIIDRDTLYPRNTYISVTIVSVDSGLADALSTALFNMGQAEGAALIDTVDGAEAMWVYPDGSKEFSSGFSDYLVKG